MALQTEMDEESLFSAGTTFQLDAHTCATVLWAQEGMEIPLERTKCHSIRATGLGLNPEPVSFWLGDWTNRLTFLMDSDLMVQGPP